MPVIRISDDVFRRLQAHAIPLEDSASDVIERLLNQCEGPFDSGTRAAANGSDGSSESDRHDEGEIRPSRDYWQRRHRQTLDISDALTLILKAITPEKDDYLERKWANRAIPFFLPSGRKFIDCESGKHVTYLHVYTAGKINAERLAHWAARLRHERIGDFQKSAHRFRISFFKLSEVADHREMLTELLREILTSAGSRLALRNEPVRELSHRSIDD